MTAYSRLTPEPRPWVLLDPGGCPCPSCKCDPVWTPGLDPGPWNPGPWTLDPWTLDPGPWTLDPWTPDPWTLDPGP